MIAEYASQVKAERVHGISTLPRIGVLLNFSQGKDSRAAADNVPNKLDVTARELCTHMNAV